MSGKGWRHHFNDDITYVKMFINKMLNYIKPITDKIYVYLDENEMLALVEGGYLVLSKKTKS